MNKQEVENYNRLCAEFLFPKAKEEYESGEITIEDGVFKKGMLIFGHYDMMRFHSDWNWIMEVVEAIEKLGFNFDSYAPIDIGKDGFYEFNIWNRITPEIEGRGNTSKEAYIDAINKFLICYNEKDKLET